MIIKFTDDIEEYSSYKYEKAINTFEVLNNEGRIVCEYKPILNLDAQHNPDNFEIHFLYNEREDYTENCIFQVYVESQRIGWIFPFQALLSDQHSYSEDVFFLKYAYVASELLMRKIVDLDKRESKSKIFLEDYYDEKMTILILDRENISCLSGFCLKDYTVSLCKHGYTYSGKGNIFSEKVSVRAGVKRITLQPLSRVLQKIDYINNVFLDEIPKAREAFARFHIYYQIIEILIQIVFNDRFERFVSELKYDEDDLFDKKEELGRITNEKQRVKWLFSDYAIVEHEDKCILNERCKRLLTHNQKKVVEDFAENLYAVRCLLVHNMYILDEYSHALLDEVNNVFLDVIIGVVLSFKKKK